MDSEFKEVDFAYYCERCKHTDLPEALDPCDVCLLDAVREGTSKPYFFTEKETK